MREIDCLSSTSKAKLRLDSISFSEIPGQSKLFLDYQTDPLALRKYYPTAVAEAASVAERATEVLEAYVTDRGLLCDALTAQNQSFGAGDATLRNIDLLRQSGTVAVVTGQQAGLFTGPLYTIYKALSAIKMSACLRSQGIDAVPVFWAATEDHDFDEIASAFMVGQAGDEVEFRLTRADHAAGVPVGNIVIPDSFGTELHNGLDELRQHADFAPELRDRFDDIWKPGRTIGEAFCRDIQRLFADHGLIVVDPLDERIKALSGPIYTKAVERSADIVTALVDRTKQLESDGYHAQVLVTPDYFPLFFHTDDGVRRAVRRVGDKYRVADTKTEFTLDELSRFAGSEPMRLSPGVMLRAVVQDYLFPNVCYFGGGAEVAYFAQNSEVYRILDRPVTTILHRQSFTVVGPKQARTLGKYDLSVSDLFAGYEALLPRIVDRFVNPTTARLFADAEENINLELNRLDQELSRIDPTLGANLATRRRKIVYHIAALQKKFRRVQVERDEMVNRQLRSLFAELLPKGQLQERRLNVGSFTVRYGPSFIDTIYDSIDLDDRGHRILYLS